MNVAVQEKKYVCIEYPAIVSDIEKALETLGGGKAISKVHSEPTRRLELRFRPKDVYCKCTHGDRFNTTNLLMKITRRRKKNEGSAESIITKAEILGSVETTYKFRSLMDYQYLPMQMNADKSFESLVPVLIPEGLKLFSWLHEESKAPVFVQPPIFSRFDQPSNYHFRRDPQQRVPCKAAAVHPPHIIGRSRKRRAGYAKFLNFEDPLPEKCTEESLKVLKQKKGEHQHVEVIKKAFETCPVWSRNALASYLNIETTQFKFVLPTLAYYFLTGPWRTFWVRFGYDPRLEPAAKIYQTLDIRIRLPPIPGIEFHYRRSAQLYNLPNKTSAPQPRIGTIERETFLQMDIEQEKAQEIEDKQDYKFKPGQLPKHKQIFYQICHVEMNEVQELVHKNDGQETNCHEKEGWFLAGTLDSCRQIILKDVQKTVDRIKKEHTSSEVPGEPELENNNDSDYEADDLDDLDYEDT